MESRPLLLQHPTLQEPISLSTQPRQAPHHGRDIDLHVEAKTEGLHQHLVVQGIRQSSHPGRPSGHSSLKKDSVTADSRSSWENRLLSLGFPVWKLC